MSGPTSSGEMINDAYHLLNQLIIDEDTANKMLAKASLLNNSFLKMKEYQAAVTSFEEAAEEKRPEPSKFLPCHELSSLKYENKRLKIALEDHQFALELAMSKYRQKFCNILNMRRNRAKVVHEECPIDLINSLSSRIIEMSTIMKETIKLESIAEEKSTELKSQLLTENQMLKALIISSAELKI